MSTDSVPSQPAIPQIRPAITGMAASLGHTNRWKILRELSAGEPLMVKEIAERIRISADLTSRHMAVLRRAGLVVCGRGNLYAIPKPYLPVPGQRLIDYGHCLLRFDETE